MQHISKQSHKSSAGFPYLRIVALLFSVFWFSLPASAKDSEIREIQLDQDTEISISIFPAKGQYRILWIPAFATPNTTVEQLASQLTALDVEVWHADFLEARFLPKTASSIYKIPEKDIISVINSANKDNNKKLFVFTESRAVIPVLLALRTMQQSSDMLKNFGGVIMNSPYFYEETPDPGVDARLMPIVNATNLPLFIFQPKNSPRFWQLKQTIRALETSGSDVFVQVLEGIRGRFLFRPDSTNAEITLAAQFAQPIARSIKYLETINHKRRKPAQHKITAIRNVGAKKDRLLQSFKGNPLPPPFSLKNRSGNYIGLEHFKQHVILLNFWASWCPPCVEEMPSLQRLSKSLTKDKFVVLGINIAESEAIVENFLSKQVNIDFEILFDFDGEVMRQWNVMAFPTSFVIDKRGKIRYALFGSIDWETPEIKNRIEKLLKE